MAMTKEFFSYRSHVIALVVLLVASIALTQIPLFNYLGYEFSALIVVLWSLSAGLLTLSLWNKRELKVNEGFAAFAARSLITVLLALVIPLVVIAVNAFFVKNCSFPQGIILFFLVTVLGVVFAHALSLFCLVVFPRRKKTSFVIAWIATLAQIPYVGLARPQIFAFNPILGFFPGLTYDETLDVTGRLLVYRIGTLALTFLVLLAAVSFDRWRNNRGLKSFRSTSLPGRLLMVVLAVAVAMLFFFSNRIGLSSSESSIQQTLGGRAETEHFIIFYPDTLIKGPRLEQVVQLHEFYYAQVARALGIPPGGKIHSYIYATPAQKGRLIGAANTDISKPWLLQMHINASDIDGSLRHELVHVMAADFGFPLLKIGVNSGLIEGLATAVERVQYEEPVHRLAAMVFATGAAPDMQSLFSLSGFMKAPAGVGYTLAGSFCRYLIDRYGMRRFKLLYKSGEYSIIYGKPLPLLLQEWRRSLDRFRFSTGDLEKANYLFKRQSIFGKECARVIANMNAETRTMLTDRHYEEALKSAEKSLGKTMSTEAVYQKTTALVRLGKYADAITFAQTKLENSTAASSFLTLNSLLGDALWGADSLDNAMKAYGEILRSHLSLSWDESMTLRQEVVLKPNLARALKVLFVSTVEDSARVSFLENIAQAFPKEPIPRYLLAREKVSAERYDEAMQLLDGIRPFDSPTLELARQRRLAQVEMALGHYQKSKMYFWQSLNNVYRETQSVEIEEKLRFCDWMDEFGHRQN
jgi:tetratricopeptide (TPR) repeat protein